VRVLACRALGLQAGQIAGDLQLLGDVEAAQRQGRVDDGLRSLAGLPRLVQGPRQERREHLDEAPHEDEWVLAALQPGLARLALQELLRVDLHQGEVQPVVANEVLEHRVGGQPHLMARGLETQPERHVGLHVAPRADSENGDAHADPPGAARNTGRRIRKLGMPNYDRACDLVSSPATDHLVPTAAHVTIRDLVSPHVP
jgi:hypothetical protein